MEKIIVLLSISILIAITSATLTSTFANVEDIQANYTLVDVIEADVCNADGAFRMVQVNFEEIDSDITLSEIEISSVFFKFGEGVVGESSVEIKLENKTSNQTKNKIICLDGRIKLEPLIIEINNQQSNSSYEIKINEKSLGIVNPDDSDFSYQIRSEENKNYLIVTGSDACYSQGAFRYVNLNFKETDYTIKSEIDISSVFFNVTSLDLVGYGTFADYLENTKETLPLEFKVENVIDCPDYPLGADEQFNFTLNAVERYLHLPPI